MNIYAVPVLLTLDHNRHQNLIVSNNKNNIDLPLIKINYARLLFNQIRYDLQQMFMPKDHIQEILQHINFSYTDIQNELLIKYLEEIKYDYLDMENDIFVLVAMIVDKPYDLNRHFWKQFDFAKSLDNMSPFNSLIDFIIEKTIV